MVAAEPSVIARLRLKTPIMQMVLARILLMLRSERAARRRRNWFEDPDAEVPQPISARRFEYHAGPTAGHLRNDMYERMRIIRGGGPWAASHAGVDGSETGITRTSIWPWSRFTPRWLPRSPRPRPV